MADQFPGLNLKQYKRYIQLVGMMSRLFSQNDTAYIDSRFVENLYCHCHTLGSIENLARLDNSFDAKNGVIGIGIKTFLGATRGFKDEKVAEFTKLAQTEGLAKMEATELASRIAYLRNKRITADANTCGIDINQSIYHCLIRKNKGVFIHEEPYPLIDTMNIQPTTPSGKKADKFIDGNVVCFSDGRNLYRYNRSKNVLLKRFREDIGRNSDIIPIHIAQNPFALLEELRSLQEDSSRYLDSRKYVVLPLTAASGQTVAEKSGINAWNAGGRTRSFGEAYIPVPLTIHKYFPDFFPMTTDQKGRPTGAYFNLHLPDGQTITASLCQQNMKALMAKHNADLVQWLYKVIDGSMDEAIKRMDNNRRRPYTYNDLLAIGKDSIAVLKNSDDSYELQMLPVGSYLHFMDCIKTKGLPPTYSAFLESLED